MTQRRITKVEASPLFWKDLADWRKHPEYVKIRGNIGGMVARLMRGEPGGDVGFQGLHLWDGIKHLHVGAKLVVFTAYPQEDTLRICALKKHDFYGFKKERKSLAGNAASVVHRAAAASAKPFPDWGRISWKDPAEIIDHPELLEISRESLDRLYQEIAQEGDDFVLLNRATAGMSDKNASRVADAWLTDLLRAEAAVQEALLVRDRHRHDHSPAEIFTGWRPEPD